MDNEQGIFDASEVVSKPNFIAMGALYLLHYKMQVQPLDQFAANDQQRLDLHNVLGDDLSDGFWKEFDAPHSSPSAGDTVDALMQGTPALPDFPDEAGFLPDFPDEAHFLPDFPDDAGLLPDFDDEAGLLPDFDDEHDTLPDFDNEEPITVNPRALIFNTSLPQFTDQEEDLRAPLSQNAEDVNNAPHEGVSKEELVNILQTAPMPVIPEAISLKSE